MRGSSQLHRPQFIRFKGQTYRFSATLPSSDKELDRILKRIQREQVEERREQILQQRFPESDRPFLPSRLRWENQPRWKTVPPKEPVQVKRYPEKSIRLFHSDFDLLRGIPTTLTDPTFKKFIATLERHEAKYFPRLKDESDDDYRERTKTKSAEIWVSYDELQSVLDALYDWSETAPVTLTSRLNQLIVMLEKLGVVPTPPLHSQFPDYKDIPRGPDAWEPIKQARYLSYKGAVYRRVADPIKVKALIRDQPVSYERLFGQELARNLFDRNIPTVLKKNFPPQLGKVKHYADKVGDIRKILSEIQNEFNWQGSPDRGVGPRYLTDAVFGATHHQQMLLNLLADPSLVREGLHRFVQAAKDLKAQGELASTLADEILDFAAENRYVLRELQDPSLDVIQHTRRLLHDFFNLPHAVVEEIVENVIRKVER